MNKTAVLAVINDITTDQRVHRHAMLLTERGYTVTVVGRKLSGSLPLERPYHIHRFSFLINKGPLFYVLFNLRLLLYLLKNRFGVIVANDLDTLGACFLASKRNQTALVYDSHEFFTGVPELQKSPFKRKIWEKLESLIFPKLQYILTVNQSIAETYSKLYNKKLHVVRNISDPKMLSAEIKDRKELGLPEGKRLLILQGSGINMNRGGEEAVKMMAYLENTVLIIIGGGDALPELHRICAEKNLGNKVKFLPRMPYAEMMQYTRHCDLGLSLDKPGNPNYEMSLPNKIFDYIHAGIPVFISNLKEPARLVNEFGFGWICNSHDPQQLAENVNFILRNEVVYRDKKMNAAKASEKLTWKNESQTLHHLYEQLER